MGKPNQKTLDDSDAPGETQEQLTQRQAAAAVPGGIVVVPSRPLRFLPPGRMSSTEVARNSWRVVAAPDTTKEEMLRSSFWQHHARDLRRGDFVEVVSEDGSFLAHLHVLATGPKDARMALLNYWQLEVVEPDAYDVPEGHRVEWGGEISKWRVLRQGEGGRWESLRDGHETRATATAWLIEHVKALR